MTLRATLEQLLDDLHKLEINTIEKPGLSAQKMPAPLLAIHNIVTIYERFDARVSQLGSARATDEPSAADDDGQNAQSLRGRLRNLQERARVQSRNGRFDDPSVRFIYDRMYEGSLTLIGIMDRAQEEMDENRGDADDKSVEEAVARETKIERKRREEDRTGPIPTVLYNMSADALWREDRGKVDQAWQLSSADRAQIRKLWELGTERVLVQTVIQIEGDVTNRISPALAGGARPHVLDVHQKGVETSLKMWGNLVGVAKELVTGLISVLK